MSTNNELLEYVYAPDPTYRWERVGARQVRDGVLHDIRMVSQTWQHSAWTHCLHIYLPHTISAPEWALQTIGSDGAPPEGVTHVDLELARNLEIVSAHLYDVPNQPLFDGLREDELLAYSLTQYLDTVDATWPLLFPMVKAAVRALDTVVTVCREETGTAPIRFAVQGASKRGWTSWLTAVADPRVAAIVPEVYDNLNLFAQMPHQVMVWETYSEMIDDYTEHRLQDKMRTPRGHQLAIIVDPYTYRKQLTLPKLLIHGLNDRYWATDALNLYWDDLMGDKYIVYAPNQAHHIADRARIRPTQMAFLRAVIAGACLPEVTAEFNEGDAGLQITLRTDTPVLDAQLWSAASANQDFRAVPWTCSPLEAAEGLQRFEGTVARPDAGYLAVVAECTFPHEDQPYVLSTQIRVLGTAST